MRIGFDVSQTCASRAGCAWHADSLAKSLSRIIGPENLVLYHHFGNWINHDTSSGTTIDGCESPFRQYNVKEAKRIWNEIESGNESLPGNPEIVHSNSFMAPSLKETPLVYTIYDLCFFTHPQYTTEENRQFCSAEFNKALEHASAFHFISQTTLEVFNERYPNYLANSNKPFKVIHLAPRLSCNSSSKSTVGPNAPWLFVGTIEPRKNIEGLLNAFEMYLKTSPKPRPLVIAGGKGWLSDSLHQRFDRLTKQGMFEYVGQISDNRLNKLYQESYAFLFPSHYEGFGLPVIEAMNFSLPVISNDINSVREFAEGVATFVNFEDPSIVASKMVSLENNTTLYQKQSSHSKATASLLDWSITAAKLIPLYKAAITYNENIRFSHPNN